MDDEVVGKIRSVISGARWRESDVLYLFAQARKLIERLGTAERISFARLNLYSDWRLHSEIDRSEAGAKMLSRHHEIVVEHQEKEGSGALAKELSTALSLGVVREELNALVSRYSKPGEAIDTAAWRVIVPMLLEIIADVPLRIELRNARLREVDAEIRARPINGTAVVQELSVIRVRNSVAAGEMTYCIQLTASDSTKIVSPISVA